MMPDFNMRVEVSKFYARADSESNNLHGINIQPNIPGAQRLVGKNWVIRYKKIQDYYIEHYFTENCEIRMIRIIKIFWFNKKLYIYAYCYNRKSERTFREDGIDLITDAAGFIYNNLRTLLCSNEYDLFTEPPEIYAMGLHKDTWRTIRPYAIFIKNFEYSVNSLQCKFVFEIICRKFFILSYWGGFTDNSTLKFCLEIFNILNYSHIEFAVSKHILQKKLSQRRINFLIKTISENQLAHYDTHSFDWLNSLLERN